MSVTTTGVAEFQAATERAASRLETELRTVARNTAARIRAGAQARVRVRTGLTKAHIVMREDAAANQVVVEVAEIPGRNPLLGVWLEFGTRRMAAQPFMGPAAQAERSNYTRDGEAACTRALGELA